MYKITTYFKSNEKGVFTKEEETATNEDYKNFVYSRIVNKYYERITNLKSNEHNEALLSGAITHYTRQLNTSSKDLYTLLYLYIRTTIKYINELNKDKIQSGEMDTMEFKITIEDI